MRGDDLGDSPGALAQRARGLGDGEGGRRCHFFTGSMVFWRPHLQIGLRADMRGSVISCAHHTQRSVTVRAGGGTILVERLGSLIAAAT
ncbi:MAG TPA: hypothetical protein DHW63_07895 [Hyphomonadaceae bacterium]|nr:hypothetical protein [Hyphomonadaceae bacterium]